MRFFAKSLLAILVALLIAGLLTYPVWLLISQFADYRADRVMRRIGEILLAVALVWILRREGLADRATFGYGVPRRDFLRQMALGFVGGLALMLPLIAGLLALDIRDWTADFVITAFMKSFLQGMITGLAVSFIEETFLRGAMFDVIRRESGALWAIGLSSLLFAAVHFMLNNTEKMRAASVDMSFLASLRIAANAFADYGEPLAHIDAFAALFALGVLLSLARVRTGAIAEGIGLRTGGVTVIAVIGDFSTVNPHAEPHWLIPSYNNVVGWLAFAWISAVAIAYWQVSKRQMTQTLR